MPSLNIENFGDLLEVTLKKFNKPNYTLLVTDTQDHIFAKALMNKNRTSVQGGKQIDIKIKVRTSNQARAIPITAHDSVSAQDSFVSGTVNWRKAETKYMFYHEEEDINTGPEQLVDLVKSREQEAMIDWVELLEGFGWDFPSASDTTTPWGIPYWITKNATEGFNGGIPSGHSSVAGLSPTTYPRLNNYTGQYTAFTAANFFKMLRTMADLTDFKSPIKGIPDNVKSMKRQYVTNQAVKAEFEDFCDTRNMNIGPDVARYDNSALFRGNEITYAPYLNNDTTNPIYQIDWGTIGLVTKSGWWQRRTVRSPMPGKRNVTAVFLDTIFNIVCYNRRMNGVLATGTSYPS